MPSDGGTISVRIYRLSDRGDGWILEVIDQRKGSLVWDKTFVTDKDALDEFYRWLEAEAIIPIVAPSPSTAPK